MFVGLDLADCWKPPQFVNGRIALLAPGYVSNSSRGAVKWGNNDDGARIPCGYDTRFDWRVKRPFEHSVCSDAKTAS
jgi:hypothetical protein